MTTASPPFRCLQEGETSDASLPSLRWIMPTTGALTSLLHRSHAYYDRGPSASREVNAKWPVAIRNPGRQVSVLSFLRRPNAL